MAPIPVLTIVCLALVAASTASPVPEPSAVLGGLGRAVGGVGRGVGNVVGGVGKGVGTIVAGVASGRPISGVVNGVSDALVGVGTGVASTLEGVGSGAAEIVGGVAGGIEGLSDGLTGGGYGGMNSPSTRESLAIAAQSLQAIATQGPSQPKIIVQQSQVADIEE